jgi:hypoxanthine phosphoribosyltransferase
VSLQDQASESLISTTQLATRITELGTEIGADYADGPEPPLLIGVLKGCTLFMSDLVRAMPIDVSVDFISISSYSDSGGRSGVVRILKDIESEVAGRDVLLVEDIVDTGLTLTYLRRTLKDRGARSLKTVTLLDKVARRIVPVEVEYRGFEIPDVFVVGFGLDFQGRYRNVPEVLAIKDIARLANMPELLVDHLWPPVKK